jgi:hypothetical protein
VQPADSTMLTTTMLGNMDGVCNSMPGWNPLDIWSVLLRLHLLPPLFFSLHTLLQRNPF